MKLVPNPGHEDELQLYPTDDEFDSRYVNITGDLMTGGLIITPTTNSTSILDINQADGTAVLDVDTVNRKLTVSSGTTGQSTIGAGLIVNNDSGSGAINDFQVNSDTLTALLVDASADTLAIGVPTLINQKLSFTQVDNNEYIDSLATGYMDYGATTAHRFLAPVQLTADSRAIVFGTGQDMDIGYDGADGYIRTDLIAPSDLNIDCGAEKTIELQTVVWKDINVGAAQLSRPASSQPDEDDFLTEAGAETGITTLAYAIGEKASGSFEIQHDYKEGSDFTFHIHWQGITDPSGDKNVQWRITYVLMRDATTLDAVTTIDSADTVIDTQYKCYRTDVVVVDGATKGNDGGGIKIGDQFLFTIERVASTGTTYAGDALVATMGIHYSCDTFGSRQIVDK